MIRASLLTPAWRFVAAALVAVSLVTLPTYLLALVLLPPVPPIVMIRSFIVGTALPAVVAWAVERAFAGTAELRDGVLELCRGDLAATVPGDALAGVHPWRISLPRPGLALRLRSGARLPVGVALDDPGLLLAALAAAGIDVTAARRHPAMVVAATRRRGRWWGPVLKFAGLGSLPAALLFYTHQHIAYGGTFGQYYLEGPEAYLRTWGEYWGTTVVLLLSWASCWRAAAETIVWLVAALRPSGAALARRLVELACRLAYYGGVPALLAARYLA